mmetsp:Transcript_14088/g.48536  ORF Transcript_14088/g.48536 Transcript_14088/m.48536 type:complete len:446 (-) Transcript_14088:1055-2392(-)
MRSLALSRLLSAAAGRGELHLRLEGTLARHRERRLAPHHALDALRPLEELRLLLLLFQPGLRRGHRLGAPQAALEHAGGGVAPLVVLHHERCRAQPVRHAGRDAELGENVPHVDAEQHDWHDDHGEHKQEEEEVEHHGLPGAPVHGVGTQQQPRVQRAREARQRELVEAVGARVQHRLHVEPVQQRDSGHEEGRGHLGGAPGHKHDQAGEHKLAQHLHKLVVPAPAVVPREDESQVTHRVCFHALPRGQSLLVPIHERLPLEHQIGATEFLVLLHLTEDAPGHLRAAPDNLPLDLVRRVGFGDGEVQRHKVGRREVGRREVLPVEMCRAREEPNVHLVVFRGPVEDCQQFRVVDLLLGEPRHVVVPERGVQQQGQPKGVQQGAHHTRQQQSGVLALEALHPQVSGEVPFAARWQGKRVGVSAPVARGTPMSVHSCVQVGNRAAYL